MTGPETADGAALGDGPEQQRMKTLPRGAQDAAAGIAVAGVRGWEQPVQPVPEPFPEPDRNTSRARRGRDEETGQA